VTTITSSLALVFRGLDRCDGCGPAAAWRTTVRLCAACLDQSASLPTPNSRERQQARLRRTGQRDSPDGSTQATAKREIGYGNADHPEVTQLLRLEGRQKVLESAGLPSAIATLANLMLPDPMLPTPVGALKFLNVAMRRTAPLARARMAKVLGDLGDTVPDRLWQFWSSIPRSSPWLTPPNRAPPGWPSQPTGRVVSAGRLDGTGAGADQSSAHDRPAALAHELAVAATGLAGKQTNSCPDSLKVMLGLRLHQRYGPKTMDAALFPTLFDQPSWVRSIA